MGEKQSCECEPQMGCCSSANKTAGLAEGGEESSKTLDFMFNITRPTKFGSTFKKQDKGNNLDDDSSENLPNNKKVSTTSILSRKSSNALGHESSNTKVGKRGTKISKLSFHECDEIRDYEKGAAIQEDGELKKKSKFKRISKMSITEDDTNANFKKLVKIASQTFGLVSDTTIK